MGESPAAPEETEEPAASEKAEDDTEESDTGSSDDNESATEDESADESGTGVRVMQNDNLGEYLADDEGMTLYYFTNDTAGTSNCTGDCLVNWPAFTASGIEAPEGYEDEDFDTITREDTGEEQVTFKGYPLYYFINDTAEGDINGQGLNGAWYAVNNGTEFPE